MHLRVTEDEQFLAIGDGRLSRLLNDHYAADLAQGKMLSLPDLLSIKLFAGETRFRVREVKFKLERRLIDKALRQLRSGMEWVSRRFEAPAVDRIELVIALQGRALKPAEQAFVGQSLGGNRYELCVDGVRPEVAHEGQTYPVSLLLL